MKAKFVLELMVHPTNAGKHTMVPTMVPCRLAADLSSFSVSVRMPTKLTNAGMAQQCRHRRADGHIKHLVPQGCHRPAVGKAQHGLGAVAADLQACARGSMSLAA